MRVFSNKYLLLAIISSIALQAAVIYTPLSSTFHTSPLSLMDWAVIVSVSGSVLLFDELRKLTSRFINRS